MEVLMSEDDFLVVQMQLCSAQVLGRPGTKAEDEIVFMEIALTPVEKKARARLRKGVACLDLQ